MVKKLTPADLRKSVSAIVDMLGDENGIVYSDGIPMLKIRRYDVTQPTPNVSHDVTQAKSSNPKAKNTAPYDVTQCEHCLPDGVQRYIYGKRYEAGTLVMLKDGTIVEAPELDAEGRALPV